MYLLPNDMSVTELLISNETNIFSALTSCLGHSSDPYLQVRVKLLADYLQNSIFRVNSIIHFATVKNKTKQKLPINFRRTKTVNCNYLYTQRFSCIFLALELRIPCYIGRFEQE